MLKRIYVEWIIIAVFMTAVLLPGFGGEKPRVLVELDADGNGLYDDAERKAMLDVILKQCPQLQIAFDIDGDGKVTVEEQTAGRHPLSQLVPKGEIVKSAEKIPWSFNIFPEWITTAYLQDDIADGKVAKIIPRGTISEVAVAVQEDAALQPDKPAASAGVEFAADSGEYLIMPRQRDSRWNYRWCIFTFRIDGASGTNDETVLVDINSGNKQFQSSPRISYSKKDGLSIRYTGNNAKGLDHRIMTTENVVVDGKGWNILVCGIRQGQMFASVNGVSLATKEKQPERFSADQVNENVSSYIGDPKGGNAAWALDSLVFGLTEPSEAMVRKMDGWAAWRLHFAYRLPAGHPYSATRPVLDAEDFPHRYVHDDAKWAEWGGSLKKEFTRSNAGGERVAPEGFERVFYDDFRAERIGWSASGEGDLWMAPGFNTAVGGSARLLRPKYKDINVYPYDAQNKQQILSLKKHGKDWFGSAMYSVNDMGFGYTWSGPKVFRIRCMFPNIDQKQLGGGLFPAFWSYGLEWLFWRTSNRIECDWLEFDGKNGHWYNGISTHYHYTHLKSIFAKNNDSYKRYKVYSGELTQEKGNIPGGLFIWDGQFHTWEFIIDRDMTYVNVTVKGEDGKDRWVEVCRAKTSPTYLERLDIQLDYALKGGNGYPKDNARQDFVVDWVEVLQKSDDLRALPEPFKSRPQLSGGNSVGVTLVCKPNLEGITDVRYYWFADGYPLTYGTSDSYKITPELAGSEIRCMVKAAGALDQPEAWSEAVKIAQ